MLMELFRKNLDCDSRYKYPLMVLWRHHLIGQVDGVCDFKRNNPRSHPHFPFALKTKVSWPKNVHEERDCLDQILLAADDPQYCVFIAHALYLEQYCAHSPNATYLFTNSNSDNAAKNLIQLATS